MQEQNTYIRSEYIVEELDNGYTIECTETCCKEAVIFDESKGEKVDKYATVDQRIGTYIREDIECFLEKLCENRVKLTIKMEIVS